MSVGYPIGSKATTSGATNSGVPKRTCNFRIGSNLRARPKSMILIMFPLFDKHKIFSGCKKEKWFNVIYWIGIHYIEDSILYYIKRMYTFKSRWIICSLCMYATPSKICFINAIQAFSVSTNSSSITRSKSSPPPMLHKMNEEIWTVYSSIANKNLSIGIYNIYEFVKADLLFHD